MCGRVAGGLNKASFLCLKFDIRAVSRISKMRANWPMTYRNMGQKNVLEELFLFTYQFYIFPAISLIHAQGALSPWIIEFDPVVSAQSCTQGLGISRWHFLP